MQNQDISKLANRVLHLLLIAFLLILTRVFYLSVVKHDYFKQKVALRLKEPTSGESPSRGIIYDRFHLPLALNKIQYTVAVYYEKIQEIPAIQLVENKEGKKVRVPKRRNYIKALSQLLGEELSMDPVGIEDLIYAQAALAPTLPFVIKRGLSERTYYRLRALEKEWCGLQTQREKERFYPQGKVGAHVIGYISAIGQEQYGHLKEEIERLQAFLKERKSATPPILPKGFKSVEEVEERLEELTARGYKTYSRVGKMGVERVFEEELRGFFDSRGKSSSGKRLFLALSSELQAFAEGLLIQNEKERQTHFPLAGKEHDRIAPPWTLGGAIVAMLPKTGEIVALASYPRFNPNDFVSQNKQAVEQALETPLHIGRIWEGKAPLRQERYSYGSKGTYEEENRLSWELYLDHVLSLPSKVRQMVKQVASIQEAVTLLQHAKTLMEKATTDRLVVALEALYSRATGHVSSHLKVEEEELKKAQNLLQNVDTLSLKKELDRYLEPLKHTDDKLLFFDLLHLATGKGEFSQELLTVVGQEFLSTYRELTQDALVLEEQVKKEASKLYERFLFPLWRQRHFKAFLKIKREEEKAKRSCQRPYTHYLSQAKAHLFSSFWASSRLDLLKAFILREVCERGLKRCLSFHLLTRRKEWEKEQIALLEPVRRLEKRLLQIPSSLRISYLNSMSSLDDLTEPLWGHYPQLNRPQGEQKLQDLALAFYPKRGVGYTRSYAYSHGATLGSLFKPVTGYEALKQEYRRRTQETTVTQGLNPLTLYDEIQPQWTTQEGMVLGRMLDGSLITRHYKGGRLPRSYSSRGKVDFLKAMERSSNIYFSLLAGEIIDHPASLYATTCQFGFGKPTGVALTGEISGYVPDDIKDNKTSLYAFAIGQHALVVTPLQVLVMLSAIANGGEVLKPYIATHLEGASFSMKERRPTLTSFTKEVKTLLFMPEEVRSKLLESLYQVVWGEQGQAQPHRIKALLTHPLWAKDYKLLRGELIGKTSTAELAFRPTLDREAPPLICKDIWFGAIGLKPSQDQGFDPKRAEAELTVVVYLRYGDYGKEAAPLAAQIIKKWREICSSHLSTLPEQKERQAS